MDHKKAQSCLRTFLEVSQMQIDEREREIRKKERFKRFFDVSKKSEINKETEILGLEKNRIQGRLDSVRLEILSMLVDRLDLVTEEMIVSRQCSNALDFIKKEKEAIELRGLYRDYPCSILEVLNCGLSAQTTSVSFSLFDEPVKKEANEDDVKASVSLKNVKIMIKSM